MATTLARWVREQLPSNKKKKQLPVLPPSRLRVITPSSSCEELKTPVSSSQGSPLFARLPYEIRHEILLEAFGNFILHMDLRLEHPKIRNKNGENNRSPHYRGVLSGTEIEKLDLSRPKQWQWWSCVCHRAPPGRSGFGAQGKVLEEPCDDECWEGEGMWCDFWAMSKPGKCRIGIMGWLLSCKQAYAEAIALLYATNTILMSGTTLVLNLPKFLLAQRLASITSVEMLLHVHPLRAALPSDPPDSDLSAFHNLLESLPRTLPSLKRLYISLQSKRICNQCDGHSYDEILLRTEALIMHPIDSMVRKMGSRLQEFIVALPLSFYDIRRFKARGEYLKIGWKVSSNPERLWRKLPRVGSGDAACLKGFWVCLGQIDTGFANNSIYCFGTGPGPCENDEEEIKLYYDFRQDDA